MQIFFLKHLQLELTILKTAANYSSLVDKTLYLENVIMGQDFLGQINIILSNKLYFSATILKDKCYHFPYKFLFSLKNLRLELTILKTPIDFLGINCHSILKVKISNYTKLFLLIKNQKKKKKYYTLFSFRNKTNHTLVGRYTTFCVDFFFFF